MSALMLLTLIAATTPPPVSPDLLPASRPTLVVAVTQDTRQPLDATALKAVDRAVADIWARYADVSVRDADDPLAVVGPDLRVHGLTGLRIADESVLPVIPHANTNLAAILVGEIAARAVGAGVGAPVAAG